MEVVQQRSDVRKVGDWGRLTGNSRATLYARCEAVGVTAGHSLDFARALRVVRLHAGRRCDWYNTLNILDERTLTNFLKCAGFIKLPTPVRSTADDVEKPRGSRRRAANPWRHLRAPAATWANEPVPDLATFLRTQHWVSSPTLTSIVGARLGFDPQ